MAKEAVCPGVLIHERPRWADPDTSLEKLYGGCLELCQACLPRRAGACHPQRGPVCWTFVNVFTPRDS